MAVAKVVAVSHWRNVSYLREASQQVMIWLRSAGVSGQKDAKGIGWVWSWIFLIIRFCRRLCRVYANLLHFATQGREVGDDFEPFCNTWWGELYQYFTLFSWGFAPACGLVCLKVRVVKDSKLLNTYRRLHLFRSEVLKYLFGLYTVAETHTNQVSEPGQGTWRGYWSPLVKVGGWVPLLGFVSGRMHALTNFGNVVCQYLKELSISLKYRTKWQESISFKTDNLPQNLTE